MTTWKICLHVIYWETSLCTSTSSNNKHNIAQYLYHSFDTCRLKQSPENTFCCCIKLWCAHTADQIIVIRNISFIPNVRNGHKLNDWV